MNKQTFHSGRAALESHDIDLITGARTRLSEAEKRRAEVRRAIAEHEAALMALRSELDKLDFECKAMSYIVSGAPAAASLSARRKVDRQELISLIKERMDQAGKPLSVSEIHAYLEDEAQVDLGSNARNYLCGILSKGKALHFESFGKQGWWLAGHSPEI